MSSNTKEIQRRIKSVRNTRKITRAMEMVAAAKMKKEISRVLQIRAYAHSAWSVLTNLSHAFEKYRHGLLEVREVKRILVILISSNRGLCGAFNSQIFRKIIHQVKNPTLMKINRVGTRRIFSSVPDEKLEFDFVAIGRKAFDYLNSRSYNVIAEFENLNYAPTPDLIRPVAKIVIDDYAGRKYDKVVVGYTDFKNTLVQEPKLRQLLPISKIDLEKQIEEMSRDLEGSLDEFEQEIDFRIEPEPRKVIEQILPRLVEMQLYHAVLESNASKESARMIAMRNANDAATEMMQKLQYAYNQLRQMGITSEIAEITSGRVALEE